MTWPDGAFRWMVVARRLAPLAGPGFYPDRNGVIGTEIVFAGATDCQPPLPQCHVQHHHHGEPEHRTQSGTVGMVAALGLRDHLLDNDKDHRSGGKGE